MKLKADHETVTEKTGSKEVVSVAVTAEPREVANTAILTDSDSDAGTTEPRKELSVNSLDSWFGEYFYMTQNHFFKCS